MGHILSIATLIGALAAGMLLAKIRAVARFPPVGRILGICLHVLLFFMGFRLGRNENVVSRLGTIGLLSIAFAAATSLGTAGVLFLGYAFGFGRKDRDDMHASEPAYNAAPSSGKQGLFSHLKEPFKLLFLVVAGFCVGFFIPLFPDFRAEKLTTWILYALLFLIGMDMTQSGVSLKKSLLKPETIFMPLGTAAGSLLGGAAL